MRLHKKWKIGLLTAGCIMLAACGKDAKESQGLEGVENSKGDEVKGMDDENKNEETGDSKEEKAMKEVIYDDMAEHLMYQGLYYDIINEEEVKIPDYYDVSLTELVIPDEIFYEGKNYRVTEIGEEALVSFYGLEKVVFGKNITTIGTEAFHSSSDLVEIQFNDNLKSIGAGAFYGCDLIEEIVIPPSVTMIGAEAFSGCAGLTSIVIPQGVTFIGTEAFCGCELLKEIQLPDTLTSLGESAFFDCTSLESITLPASIGTVPYGLFTNCSSLSHVEISEGITVIDKEVFWACESLEEITIPNSVVHIGERPFYQSGLKSITFPENSISFGEDIFDYCDEIATVYVKAASEEHYKALLKDYEELEFIVVD